MRLRGVLERQKRLMEVVKALEKLHKNCTVVFSPDTIVLAVNPGSLNEAQVWATLKTECPNGTGVFRTFRIESQQQNKIAFEIETTLFSRALKSAEPGEMATVKLTKKGNCAYLSFEIITQSIPMMTVIQDVPVTLLSPQQMEGLEEPGVDQPTVLLCAPPSKTLMYMVERLKGLHDRISLNANMNGELELGVSTDMVFMTNFWKDLPIGPSLDGQPTQPRDPSKRAEATLDAVLLYKVLSSHVLLRPTSSLCCMTDRDDVRLVVWLLFIGDTDTVTYFLPVMDS